MDSVGVRLLDLRENSAELFSKTTHLVDDVARNRIIEENIRMPINLENYESLSNLVFGDRP
ncbi:hypothetical protein NECAME_19015 [Necator americanus]|uniref:Uncharacterized protein n=1 Tax=Necator americanus TaxID=51031 RepID=W2STE3_NECAM|nr:hypothetical protein NECAME_19015 [Necator americanus]ETN72126.1 hypothetical protein NECAME_19015 [Necator americanus]